MRSVRFTSCVIATLAFVPAIIVVAPAGIVEATSIVAFDDRVSFNANGSIAIFGNNLMVCPPSAACTASRNGTNSTNNNGYSMVHLDVDGSAFPTFSSSAADVVLPDGGQVLWAGLYWGARLESGSGGVDAIGNGRQMKLRAPGDAAYRAIDVAPTRGFFGPSSSSDRAYQAFADVTAIVRAAGPGTYFGADVPAATGEDRYSGWSLVVAYSAPSLPLRNLTIFDGLADVGQNDPQAVTISGFTTPVTGTVNTRIGLVAYEGDRGSTGDRANFNGTQLATRISQGTNFFNGGNDDNGRLVTARNPADVNMLGFDIKNFDAPGILANNATSARIDLASTSERYFPGVVTTAIDVFAPDFSPSTKTVTNMSGGDPARVGDTLRYTVTFVNGGQDPAINTSIEDPIPPGTTYVPGSLVLPGGVTGSFVPAANAVRLSPGNFPVGRSVTFTFDVLVGDSAASTNVANRASITYDGATVAELQDLTFSTAAASTAVVASADLSITKVNSPAAVVAGNTLTSTITVRNAGPSPATSVVVTDELPAGVTATATSSQGSCSVNLRLVTCPIGTVAAGATVTVTVQTAVPPGSTAASLTDVARVSSATDDPDPDDNTSPAASPVTRNADLSVTKTVTPTTIAPGQTVTYTINVTNNGPSTANAVVIDDAVPDPDIEPQTATSNPSGPCTTDPSNARCTIPSLAPGATATMTVIAVALPSATPHVVPNDAIVSSATPDANTGNNTASANVTISPAVSDLEISKTAEAPSPLIAGLGAVRYTIDVANNGPSDADPVTVTDVTPPGFHVVSATTDRGSCAFTTAPTGDTVTCVMGRFVAPFDGSPGASGSVTIVTTVPATIAPGEYPNVATVSAPSAPPTSSAPAPVTVESRANLSIIKAFPADAPDTEITPGTAETYRIRVVNDGPSAALDVVVTDSLPPELTPTAWRVESVTPPGPAPVCDVATATCDLGDLPPDTTVELEIDVLVSSAPVDPDLGVVNRAEVTTSSDDPNPDDNIAIFTASGLPQADLSIRKFAPPIDPIAGDNGPASLASRTFTFEIVNFGPSAAQDIVLTDVLPPGVTFVRLYDTTIPDVDLSPFVTCDAVGVPQTVTCTFIPSVTLPASVGIAAIGMEVTFDATIPDGTVLSNTGSISSSGEDGNPGNNTSTALVNVRAVVNLVVEKLVVEMGPNGDFVEFPPVPHPEALDPLGVAPGLPVSFAVVVTNQGPSAAADVQTIDAFPIDAAYFPVGDCDFLNGETVCRYTNGTDDLLMPGGSFGVQIITVLDGDTPPGVVVNTGRASTSTTETTLADNVDTRPILVTDRVADLIVEKQAVNAPFVAGGTFSYQVAVSAGRIDIPSQTLRFSSDAENVVVTDTLPAGLVPTGATTSQGECTVAGQTVSCTLGTVESSIDLVRLVPPALVTITGTVASDFAASTVDNTAVATTSNALLGGGTSRESSVTTPVEHSSDLAVTKVADSPTATAGGGITFTVTVTNTGPSDAAAVIVTDLLPSPFEFAPDASDGSCTLVAGEVTCALGTVPSGTSRAITIAATLPPDAAPEDVINTASVPTAGDPDGSNNSASAGVAIVQSADLSITKTAPSDGVLLGGTIPYTLTVVNGGPSNATGIVLTESIPAGTTIVSLPPECTGTGPLTCNLVDLAAGDVATLELELGVPDTLQPGPLDNTASVVSDIADPDLTNNETTTSVEAVAQADVTVTKELVTANPVAGQPLEFRLTVVNHGPTVAPNASISDTLAPGLTFRSGGASQGTCKLDEAEAAVTASCDLGRMEVGATVTATLIVDTDPSLTSVSNIAFAGSGGLDILTLDNEDGLEFALQRVADLSVTKTGPPVVSAVAPPEYTIAYRNDGPSIATDVVVTDTLPPGLTPRPVSGCTITGSTVTCGVASLAPGAGGSITITADVDPDLALGTELTDVAGIGSDAQGFQDPDPTDNTSTLTSTVQALNDIGVTVTADQEQVVPGSRAGYTVVVVNNGPHRASGVMLTNRLPIELVDAFARGSATTGSLTEALPAGCSATGSVATCDVGDLAVGESRSYGFTGTVPAGTPPSTQLVDTASVAFDGTDAVAANNTDADTILVIAPQAQPPNPPPAANPPAPGGGTLPATGASTTMILALALALALSGAGLRTATDQSRRRRRR